jgi:hypothetical protein
MRLNKCIPIAIGTAKSRGAAEAAAERSLSQVLLSVQVTDRKLNMLAIDASFQTL